MEKFDAALKNAMKEFLEPYGFKKIKGRHPYFVKMIKDEIVEVITFRNQQGIGYSLFCGIETIYGPELDFSKSPRDNTNWLNMCDVNLYSMLMWDSNDSKGIIKPNFPLVESTVNENEFEQSIHYVISVIKELILPVFDKVIDLKSCMEFLCQFESVKLFLHKDIKQNEEGLLNYIVYNNVKEYEEKESKLFEKWDKITVHAIEDGLFRFTKEELEEDRKQRLKQKETQVMIFAEQLKTNEVYEEIERRKDKNVKSLIAQGII